MNLIYIQNLKEQSAYVSVLVYVSPHKVVDRDGSKAGQGPDLEESKTQKEAKFRTEWAPKSGTNRNDDIQSVLSKKSEG